MSVSDKDLLERMVSQARSAHPTSWILEEDWTFEVRDAEGDVVVKCVSREEADAIIEIAKRQEAEAAKGLQSVFS